MNEQEDMETLRTQHLILLELGKEVITELVFKEWGLPSEGKKGRLFQGEDPANIQHGERTMHSGSGPYPICGTGRSGWLGDEHVKVFVDQAKAFVSCRK